MAADVSLDDSGCRVLAGELEAVRTHGIDSGQISGIWNHVPRQGQGDVLVIPESQKKRNYKGIFRLVFQKLPF